MNTQNLPEIAKRTLIHSYKRPDIVFERGKGVYLYDTSGKPYIDFISGIGVSSLGHCHQDLVEAAKKQIEKLWHCSNLYHSPPHIELALLLTQKTFAEKVFFCNSGAESVETAIKFARKWGHTNKGADCYEIISFKKSFHGRSMGALSATGNEKYWKGFEPMLDGFKFAELNNINSVKKLISQKTCAVILEPIQGEGGINPAEKDFILELKELSREHNFLLIFDEIQCGLGRTGYFSAHEYFGVTPDIMTIAKPLAGGLPIGAILTTSKVGENINPGEHGSTFGGNPVTTAVAIEVVKRTSDKNLLNNVRTNGEYLKSLLEKLKERTNGITDIRGRGFMIGVEFNKNPEPIIQKCFENGLLVCKSGETTIRLLPPLITTKEQIEEAVSKLEKAMLS